MMWRRLFRAGVTRKVPPHHSPAMPTPTTLQPAKHPPRRNSSRATEDPRRNQNFSPVSRGPACAPGASTIPAGSLRRAHFLTAQLEGDHVSRETRRNASSSLRTNSSGSRCRNRHDLPSMIRAESQCAANACEPPVRYRTTMRTWSTAARTTACRRARTWHTATAGPAVVSACTDIRNAADRARIHHSTAGWFPSRTCDDGVTDHRPGRRGGAEPRPTGMPNESAGPSAHHSAVSDWWELHRAGPRPRVKDLIRRLRSAPGRRRGGR